ncbi:hypothetical protein D4A35_16380 [Paraclostridium bifermentans]|uniref:Uncharacterized protein n=1 Tax=Paraclostridium bifermentans TaxID=1490 RepID=A0A5P3XJA8_PARBF|nr:hypothetical protein [Paraclostridium bifermentans]QEZ70396.1 hypothetical protein D4A35_16380 [Paraclostridium bifermentans]
MCDQKTTIQALIDTIILIEDLSCIVGYEKYFFVPISITTDDGSIIDMVISNSKDDTILINNDVIIYKNTAINLSNITKVKILTQNIPSSKFKSLLLKKLENLVTFDSSTYNFNSFSNPNEVNSFNQFNSTCNIQDYINENIENIKTVSFNTPLKTSHTLDTKTMYDNVLNESSSLDITKEHILTDFNLDVNNIDVVSHIEKLNSSVVSNIETEKKLVLTDKSNEIEVSKPIYTDSIDVLTDLDISNYKVSINPSSTSAVDKVNKSTIDCLSDIDVFTLKNTLSNIDESTQIIKSNTIEVLDFAPINKGVNKSELDGKPLMIDPTGERYIGVVLDDGTFEPLKINLKKLTVIDENVSNLLGNINVDSQLNSSISSISKNYTPVIKDIDVNYNTKITEYNEKNIASLNSSIKIKKQLIKNITNSPESTKAVCKEGFESISSLNKIDKTDISNITDVKYNTAVDKIDVKKNKHYVVEDLTFNKEVSNVLSGFELSSIDHISKSYENINGTVDYVGNGIVIVNNNDSNITIYPISKISVIN